MPKKSVVQSRPLDWPKTANLRLSAGSSDTAAWTILVDRHGGCHHGYFLPSEGANDCALALFSFESLAAYEQHRKGFGIDPEFIEADRIRDETGCVIRYDRTFMRPLLPDAAEVNIVLQSGE